VLEQSKRLSATTTSRHMAMIAHVWNHEAPVSGVDEATIGDSRLDLDGAKLSLAITPVANQINSRDLGLVLYHLAPFDALRHRKTASGYHFVSCQKPV
jgi:hypothetical protein